MGGGDGGDDAAGWVGWAARWRGACKGARDDPLHGGKRVPACEQRHERGVDAADYERWCGVAGAAGLGDGVQEREDLRSCFGFGVIRSMDRLGCGVRGGGGQLVGGEDPAFGLGGAGAVDPAGGEGGGRCGGGVGREGSEDEGVGGGEVVLEEAGQGKGVWEEGEEVRDERGVRRGVGEDLGEGRHLEGFSKISNSRIARIRRISRFKPVRSI